VRLPLTSDRRTADLAVGALLATAGVMLALLALRTADTAPELGYAALSARGVVELVLPGLFALGVALESLRRGQRDLSTLLLALVALASFLPELSVPGTRPALAFTLGLVFAWSAPPLAAHLALVYPGRPLPLAVRVVRDVGYLTAIAGLGLLPTLAFDPVETGCGECSTNLLLVHAGSRLQTTFEHAAIVAALVWATVCVVVLVHRLVRATSAGRLLLWPVIVPAALLVTFFAIELALSVHRAYLSTGGLDRRLWLGGQAALVCLAVGYAARWLRTRRARTVLARDVVDLSTPTTLDTVTGRLAAALGDPTLDIAYAVGDPPRLVDAHGAPVDPAPQPDRTATSLPGTQAVLRHRKGLMDDPALIAEIARVAGLALRNERLRADAEARLALLQASRKRIVEAADDERQRLERNLHDGAQQRLVTLAVGLRAARVGTDVDSTVLDEAQAELTSALDELRVIARGIYPAVLAEMGFATAIEALAETAPLPIKLGELPRERLDPNVEATAYFVVADLARDPAAGHVTISGRRDGNKFALALTTDAPTNDVTRLLDRVGAAGGSVRTRPLTDQLALDVEIPCGS
jgi:signal transduction histidine kinase